MKFWLLSVIAGTSIAQWRHFGETRPVDPSRPADALVSGRAEMLTAHNAARAEVGVAPLEWSDRLAARSQAWADMLFAEKQFKHTKDSGYGENLFEIFGAGASPTQVVKTWVGESRDYDHKSNTCRGMCGHYTQVVWRSTKEVGCGVARGGAREIWVCSYYPPGNWIGKRPY